jgi:ribosomal protein S18 acetylase RimI-like enzyme
MLGRQSHPMSTSIREAKASDWPQIWAILEPVFRAGETYTYTQDITAKQAHETWLLLPSKTFVYLGTDGAVIGTYYLKANQPGRGSHVRNCGYVVSTAARGLGAASAMCKHSQEIAAAMGFRSMQFNCVISTNEGAVHLWQQLGFAIVSTLPEAFKHPTQGYVDAYVMYKHLVPA